MAYYMIKSKLSGLYLDVEGQGHHGAKVIPWEKNGHDNQIWYDDPSTGTIRSKWNNCALTVEHDQLYVHNVQPGNPNQQWSRQGDVIRNRSNNKVLDVFGANKEKLAQIGQYDHNGGLNQQWEFENVAGSAPASYGAPAAASPYFGGQKKEFYIASELNSKVLDIAEGKKEPGTKIVMWEKHPGNKPNQLWYLDAQGNIRSSLNDLAISNAGKGKHIQTAQASGDPRSQFKFQGNKVINGHGEVLDISGENKKDGAEVITYDSNNGKNQQWRQEFV